MTALLVGALAVVMAVTVFGWVRWLLWRSSLSRRIGRVVLQLDREAGEGEENIRQILQRLESAAERSAIERNLVAEERSRLYIAINELEVGLVVIDQDGAAVASNDVAERYLEARHAEVLVGAAVNDLLSGARQGRNGERLVTLTGPPPRVIRVSAQVIFDDQRPLGAVAVIDDRTEATRIDQVRRDLVANLSHELRIPISAIAFLAETLSGEFDGVVSERLIGRISTEADRVGDIIEDLLELSRVELEGTPRHDMVDVEALLASAADQVRSSAGARGVRLARLPAPGDLRLIGDRGQLLRAVVNLLENAINYSDADSEIELGAVGLGTATVDIVVRDRGIGIPQHEHERIFERFYRVDKARSRGMGGTGLGLSIVRHIVVNHDGEILVRSREGEGATFTLRLPSGSA